MTFGWKSFYFYTGRSHPAPAGESSRMRECVLGQRQLSGPLVKRGAKRATSATISRGQYPQIRIRERIA
jgi:hypothetical protein